MSSNAAGLAVAKKTPNTNTNANRKPLVIQMRGSEEWKAWVEKLAKHHYQDVAGVVEIALRSFAKSTGFDEPQPER